MRILTYQLGANSTASELHYQALGTFGQLWVVFCYIGLCLSLLAFTLTYVFKKQRRFPMCMAGWFCGLDAMNFLEQLFKYGPIQKMSDALLWKATPSLCAFSNLWGSVWIDGAVAACNIAISLMIFLSVVKKTQFVGNNWYYAIVVTSCLTWSFLYTLVLGLINWQGGYTIVSAWCGPKTYTTAIIQICMNVTCIIIEVGLVGYSILYAYQVFRNTCISFPNLNVQGSTKNLCIKFGTIVILQSVPRLVLDIYYYNFAHLVEEGKSEPLELGNHSGGNEILVVTVFYWVNAIVVLSCNKSLRKYIEKKYYKPQKTEPQIELGKIEIELL